MSKNNHVEHYDAASLSLSRARALAEILTEGDVLQTAHHHHTYACVTMLIEELKDTDTSMGKFFDSINNKTNKELTA